MLAVLQGGLRPREPRTKVLVPCRLNRDGRWSDACIHNVSSRGMLIASDEAPKPGSYVELRRGTLVLIGRVMWCEQRFFGVRTQDRLVVADLVNEPRLASKPQGNAKEGGERRAPSRLAAEGQRAREVERNRFIAAKLQFVCLIGAGLAGAAILAQQVHGLLGGVSGAINAAFGHGG